MKKRERLIKKRKARRARESRKIRKYISGLHNTATIQALKISFRKGERWFNQYAVEVWGAITEGRKVWRKAV